ncbi:putative rhamnosyl transferase [Frigidibacter sp. SLM-1]|nr:putative rhamnosyl transferase [Frigidibacter sp. ROC022]MCR8726532.1 putative rhamnosyl transferase [Frigidibacter sp. ROC022]
MWQYLQRDSFTAQPPVQVPGICRWSCLSSARGFRKTPEGCSFQPVAARFRTPGLLIYTGPKEKASVLDFHHLQLWLKMPTPIRMEKPMFVRGAHHDNDSGPGEYSRRMRRFRFRMARLPTYMRRRFGIDVEALQANRDACKAEVPDAA